MTPEQKDKCKKIIDHYGIAKQRRQLVEECAELIQAITKLERAGESGDGGAIYVAECGLREEIADVTIMLEQIKSTPLLGSKKNLNGLIEYKLNRQLDRIAGGGHRMNRPALYICDPEKNTECKKTSCSAKDAALPCSLTTKAEFAKTDENGQPIAADDDDWPF